MSKIIVIGGGWAGVGAALEASKSSEEVTLLERTDLLLGLGNVGGIFRNNGRYTAAEEMIAMGGGELFEVMDSLATHKNVDFPGHEHASFYNVLKIEPVVRRLLKEYGVSLCFETRVVDVGTKVTAQGNEITFLKTVSGETIEGDVFIDATGTTGSMGNCMEYGNGCSMCILRCPRFGPRVSISEKAGGRDYFGKRQDGSFGAFSGSCKLDMGTLSKKLQAELQEKGFVVVPLPDNFVNKSKLSKKVCKQYALDAFAENIILIDTGHAKMMTPFMPLEELRQVDGFENVRFVDPYGGGSGNSIRYLAVAERDEFLRVKGVSNLFCAGEKAGTFVGHTEAICTGALAGFNAVKLSLKEKLLELPETTAVGAIIKYQMGKDRMITFAGDEFFEYMRKSELYATDAVKITERIEKAGLKNIYNSFN